MFEVVAVVDDVEPDDAIDNPVSETVWVEVVLQKFSIELVLDDHDKNENWIFGR